MTVATLLCLRNVKPHTIVSLLSVDHHNGNEIGDDDDDSNDDDNYFSAAWPTRCLASTFRMAASSLSNKSKLPWKVATNIESFYADSDHFR